MKFLKSEIMFDILCVCNCKRLKIYQEAFGVSDKLVLYSSLKQVHLRCITLKYYFEGFAMCFFLIC